MDDRLGVGRLEQPLHAPRVQDVQFDDVHPVDDIYYSITSCTGAVNGKDFLTAIEKLSHHVRANKSACAGDEYAHQCWRRSQLYGISFSRGSSRIDCPGSWGCVAQLATMAISCPMPLKPFQIPGGI